MSAPKRKRLPRHLRQRPLGIKPGAMVLLALTPVALVATLAYVLARGV